VLAEPSHSQASGHGTASRGLCQNADRSRYLYVVALMILPALAVAADYVARQRRYTSR